MNRTLQDVGKEKVSPGSTERAAVALTPTHALGRPGVGPNDDAEKVAFLDQVYEDYCQVCSSGDSVDPHEFALRYSRYRHSIRLMLDVHRFIEENPDLLTETAPPPWPELGTEYLGFRLIDELGRGSFARVYLAAESELADRLVAVKLASDNLEEARIIARLEHPHIVPIHSVRTDELTGRTLICMPYLGSATLVDLLDALPEEGWPATAAEVLSELPQPDDRVAPSPESLPSASFSNGSYVRYVLRLGAALADALAKTHSLGICHGDLKPSNVLLVADGRPMLLDFNLSLAIGDVSRLGGTLPYVAPEQLQALVDVRNVTTWNTLDERCDLFSLGAILYELLTGELPFGSPSTGVSLAGSASEMLVKRREGARPIREINPEVDRRTAAIVERCLRFDPMERPASAAELARQLRGAASPAARAKAWTARHPMWTATIVAAWFGMFAAAGVWWINRPSEFERAYQAAVVAFEEGDYQEARQLLNRAIPLAPEHVDARFLRGRVYANLDRPFEASRDFEFCLPYYNDGKAHAILAYSYTGFRMYNEGAKYGAQALERGYRNAAVLTNLAACYLRTQRESEALDLLEKAISLDDSIAAAYQLRAIALRETRPGDVAALSQAAADHRLAMQMVAPREYYDLPFEAGKTEIALAEADPSYVSAAAVYLSLAAQRGMSTLALSWDPKFRKIPWTAPEPPVLAPERMPLAVDPLRGEKGNARSQQ